MHILHTSVRAHVHVWLCVRAGAHTTMWLSAHETANCIPLGEHLHYLTEQTGSGRKQVWHTYGVIITKLLDRRSVALALRASLSLEDNLELSFPTKIILIK